MFNPKTKEKVKELFELELQQAKETWGETYDSLDQADSVLLEEIQEARVEVRGIETAFLMWLSSLKNEGNENQHKTLNVIQKLAENGIKELAQVYAVCEKIKNSNL